jgi:predicted DNA-binding transcriptional regulator AlpA
MTPDQTQPATVFLDNKQAADFLKLSPRTLEKHRVVGGGPRFRKFGRRVVYAVADLEAWANERICKNTSDANYVTLVEPQV